MIEIDEKTYALGFNAGYLIAKHEPELFTVLTNRLESKLDYFDGLKTGGVEYSHEKHLPVKDRTKNKDIEKEK